MLLTLLTVTILNFLSPMQVSDLIVDQKHLDQKLKVNIDIEFPKYPCSMLSLDIENILKVHEVNIGGGIRKYKLPEMEPFEETNDRAEKYRRIKEDFTSGKGCRMMGWF